MPKMEEGYAGRQWLLLRIASLLVAFAVGLASIYEPELEKMRAGPVGSTCTFLFFFLVGFGAAGSRSEKNETDLLASWSRPLVFDPAGILGFMALFFTMLGTSFIFFHGVFRPASASFGLIPLSIGLGLLIGIQLRKARQRKI